MVNSSTESRLGGIIAKYASRPFILVDPCPIPAYSRFIVYVAIAVTAIVLSKQ